MVNTAGPEQGWDADGGQPAVLAGRYELGELIGSGGMARVYRGRDRELDRPVAIKLLPHGATSEHHGQRLRQEARTAAALTHRGVVAIYDLGETDGCTFIVIEYVNGETLRTMLSRRGTLDPDTTLRVGAQVCAALHVAHGQGIIHRDINPGNIMIDTDSSARVLDFGIAQSPGARVSTEDGLVLGTPGYTSPEQARGAGLDPRTDLYSLGCCLYEMMTGQQPFTGDSPESLAYQHVHRQPELPRVLKPEVPTELQGIIVRSLAKQPADRYDTAESMRVALDQCRITGTEPEPMSATDVSGPTSATRPSPANTRLSESPTRPMPWYATLRSEADDRDPIESHQGSKRSGLGLSLIVASLLVVLATIAFLGYRSIAGS